MPWVLGGCSELGWQVWDGLGDCQMDWFGIIKHPGSSQCKKGVTGALNASCCHIPSLSPQILPALQQAALKRTRRGEVSLVLSFQVHAWKFHAASPPKGSQGGVGEFPLLPLAPLPLWAGLSHCKGSNLLQNFSAGVFKGSSHLQNFSTGVFWRLAREGLAVAGGDSDPHLWKEQHGAK